MKIEVHCRLLLILLFSIQTVRLFDLPSRLSESDEQPTTIQTEIILGNQYSSKAEIYQLTFHCNNSGCLPLPLQLSDLLWSSPDTQGISEVKYVNYRGQPAILATTQSGAIVYEYPSGTTLFHKELEAADGVNVHSAEVLPDGNVVIAGSTSDGIFAVLYPDGDNVNQDLAQTTMANAAPFGHGVVYDKSRSRLYAAGYLTFLALDYSSGSDGRGSFEILQNVSLDSIYDESNKNEDTVYEDGVHDLYPVDGNSDTLFLTTGEHVFTINIENFSINTFQSLYTIPSQNAIQKEVEVKNKGGVKVISYDYNAGLVLAKPSPWFKEYMTDYDQNYSPYNPILVWTMPNKGSGDGYCSSPDYDLTNNCKINFDLLEPIWFYKVRFFVRPSFSY